MKKWRPKNLWRPKTTIWEKKKIVDKIANLLKLWLTINQAVDLYNKQHRTQWIAKMSIYYWYRIDKVIKDRIDWYKKCFQKQKRNATR